MVCHFHRYWAYSSKSTVRPKMESCFQDGACSVCFFLQHQFFGARPSSQPKISHPSMTTGKTIALTRWTYFGKGMSLLFNMLSRLVITFLPRSKCLFISWQQSPSAVILESKKIKSVTVSTVSPSISHEVMRPDAMIFVF